MLAGVISTVSTDALLLKHQVISTQSADYEFIQWQWASFIKKIKHLEQIIIMKYYFDLIKKNCCLKCHIDPGYSITNKTALV